MKDTSKIIAIIIFFSFLGCSSIKNPDKYIAYVEKIISNKHTLVHRNNYKIRIVNVPSDYYTAKEILVSGEKKYAEIKEKYKQNYYLIIEMVNLVPQKNRMIATEDKLKDHFGMKKKFYLINESDTSYSLCYRFEEPKTFVDNKRYVITFDKANVNKKTIFVFKSSISQIGTVKIELNKIFDKYKKLGL